MTCCAEIRLTLDGGTKQLLMCTLEAGHQGHHYDEVFGYDWRQTVMVDEAPDNR